MQSTPKSGDQGIDLILTKDGKTTIVQCKGKRGSSGPAVVRELYGSFAAYDGAHCAILACNGGFTQGVEDFARGKPIILISAIEIAKMAERVTPFQQRQPIAKVTTANRRVNRPCPNCGSKLNLYRDLDSMYWKCSRYPECGFVGRGRTDQHLQLVQANPTPTSIPKVQLVGATQPIPKEPASSNSTGPQCPSCGSGMALMELGEGDKGNLWGCPRYPECKGARDLSRRVLRY